MAKLAKLIEEALAKKQGEKIVTEAEAGNDTATSMTQKAAEMAKTAKETMGEYAKKAGEAAEAAKEKAGEVIQKAGEAAKENATPLAGAALAAGALGAGLAAKKFLNRKKK